MLNIIYIHGFASSGNATKAAILKDYALKNRYKDVISPDLPAEPEKAMKLINEIAENTKGGKVIFGSSLGGFYALNAASRFGIPCVLINPAVYAHKALESVVGINTNYKTGEKFEFKKEYLLQLGKIFLETDLNRIESGNIILMLAEDDDLLDYTVTLDYLKNGYGLLILEKNAGHEFTEFGSSLDKVFDYLKQKNMK